MSTYGIGLPVWSDPHRELTVRDILPTVIATLREASTDAISAFVLHPESSDPTLVIEECGDRHQLSSSELLVLISQSTLRVNADTIRKAVRLWIEKRPATESDARQHGIAVLGWNTENETPCWSVSVKRGPHTCGWLPSQSMSERDIRQIRADALSRSHNEPVELVVSGSVAVWSHPTHPALSSAILVRPDHMRAAMNQGGMKAEKVHVVVSPPGPIACADATAARRLSDETVELHQVVPWELVADLQWM